MRAAALHGVAPGASARVQKQLGLRYEYATNAGGGQALDEATRWGSAAHGGKIGDAEILFPRVENDAA